MGFFEDLMQGAQAGYQGVEGGAPMTAGGMAGATAGVMGRYAVSPLESLQTLGNSMQSAYEGNGYNPDEVTAALMDVGMMSTPFNTGGMLGSFGGKRAPVQEFGPLEYWLPMAHPERMANFEKWARDSVLLDETGRPATFGHGTNGNLFDAFDVSKAGSNTDADDALGWAAWLTDEMRIASDYARGEHPKHMFRQIVNVDQFSPDYMARIIPGHVRAENPFIYDARFQRYTPQLFDELAAEARKPEYDAMLINNVRDGIFDESPGNVIAVKDPNQFKSLWNSGEYGPTDNFMRSTVPYVPQGNQEGLISEEEFQELYQLGRAF